VSRGFQYNVELIADVAVAKISELWARSPQGRSFNFSEEPEMKPDRIILPILVLVACRGPWRSWVINRGLGFVVEHGNRTPELAVCHEP